MTIHVRAGDDSPVHQALIAKALERFHLELGNEDPEFTGVSSPEELLAHARSLESLRQRTASPGSLLRLESILAHINDFAAVVALSTGFEPKVTGIVWGSLKIILALTTRTTDTYDGVLSMLDDLSLALPRFKTYAETIDMTPDLETSLVDVYTEMTCFCARAIRFFRSSPHGFLVRSGWSQFNGDFTKTLHRLKTLSQIVDQRAQAARLRMSPAKNTEVMEAVQTMALSDTDTLHLPCHVIPEWGNVELFGREDTLQQLDDLFCGTGKPEMTCALVHGLGGVGKSSLAAHFAKTHRSCFDVIIWVTADSQLKVSTSYQNFALQLGLISQEDMQTQESAVTKTKHWLQTSGQTWLLVIDNVDSSETLSYAWPRDANGAILVTARDDSVTFGTLSTRICLDCLDIGLGASMLLRLTASAEVTAREKREAEQIVTRLGCLPLAIRQMSAFILKNRLTLSEFSRIYDKNAEKIDGLNLERNERTIGAVWETALQNLPTISRNLLGVLALFDPDGLQESVLTDAHSALESASFEFPTAEFDFSQAKLPLFESALLERRLPDTHLKMHRLVQTAAWRRLSPEDKMTSVQLAVKILGTGFPNTWNTVTTHQFSAWKACEERVTHVGSLLRKVSAWGLIIEDAVSFAELAFRFGWYLYERELYLPAEQCIRDGLDLLKESDTLTCASARILQGLIELDTGRHHAALESFLAGLHIRGQLLPRDDEFIASSHNAISLAYTELGELAKAVQHGQTAIDIRLNLGSERIGNSYSNMASTLLKMGRPNEAEAVLKKCPALKNFTDETFLGSGNPRFAGDMVLLSRIRREQGQLDEALRLASKALTFRQQKHGDSLKTCDTMQLVADMLSYQNDEGSAMLFFSQSAAIAERLPYAQGYLARAYSRLTVLHESHGDPRQAEVYRTAVESLITEVNGRTPGSKTDATVLEKQIPWMLW